MDKHLNQRITVADSYQRQYENSNAEVNGEVSNSHKYKLMANAVKSGKLEWVATEEDNVNMALNKSIDNW